MKGDKNREERSKGGFWREFLPLIVASFSLARQGRLPWRKVWLLVTQAAYMATLYAGLALMMLWMGLLLWELLSGKGSPSSDSVAIAADSVAKNGFVLADTLVPADEILRGGPPRDGIPSIDHPRFAAARAADFIGDDDWVLGLAINGEARAYPINILNWHELVNDKIGDVPFVVSYCPLCGSGVVFHSRAGGRILRFGVSGLLYNSDVLLYDRQTESLWSQLLRTAVSGELKGTKLTPVAVDHTTWRDWKTRHPRTLILTPDTGHRRDYSRSPYGDYNKNRSVYFPVNNVAPSDGYHPKEWVLGVEANKAAKAYPFVELNKNGENTVIDAVGGVTLTIHWDAENWSARLAAGDDDFPAQDPPAAAVRAFWFAWFAFHPQTEVFAPGE